MVLAPWAGWRATVGCSFPKVLALAKHLKIIYSGSIAD